MKETIMKKILHWLMIVAILAPLSYGAPGKVTGGSEHETPEWFKQSFLDIPEDVAEATDNNKHLMLFVDLDGCPYCTRMLHESFEVKNPTSDFIKKHFDVVNLNVKGSREVTWDKETVVPEKDLAIKLGIQYSPTILFLDKDQNIVLRINGYRSAEKFKDILLYIQGEHYKTKKLTEFLEGLKNKNLYTFKKNTIFQEINDLSKIKTPLAIIFEDGGCVQCEYFHNTVLKNNDVQKEFEKFTVVRFDATSSKPFIGVDGKKTTPKEFVKSINLDYRPGVLLYDNQKLIATVDALLYSFHFKELLRFVGEKEYKHFPGFLEYLSVRQKELLDAGISIDLSK